MLVAAGAWLVLRDRLPEDVRTPVAMIGTGALILIGLLIAATTVASMGLPYASRTAPVPMPWPMMQIPFGRPALQDTLTLSAPADGISSIELATTSGSTLVRSTADPNISVKATRHFWSAESAPDVQLVPSGATMVVTISAADGGIGTDVDYVIDAPARLGATLRSASGSIRVSGLDGPVTISSVSGAIYGSDLARVIDVHSISGAIDLTGDFSTPAQIGSVSGSVNLGFTPVASAHIDAASSSGDAHAEGLTLTGQSLAPHTLMGDVGLGGPTIFIRTTSGSIRLMRSP
jgi:hypothetical protein